MDSTTAKVLFVAALFAGIAGMVVQSGVAMEKGMGLDEMAADERVVSLESSGKTILTASAVLFAAALFAGKRAHGLHRLLGRSRVWSVTISLPSGSRAGRGARPMTYAPPPPPPPRPVVRPLYSTNYVAVAPESPMDELIASCSAIRFDSPAAVGQGIPTRRSAGRYR